MIKFERRHTAEGTARQQTIVLRTADVHQLGASQDCGVCGKPHRSHLDVVGRWIDCYTRRTK